MQIRAAAFRGAARSTVIDAAAITLDGSSIPGLVPGLEMRTAKGAFTTCPPASAFAAAAGRLAAAIDLGDLAGTDEFAVLFDGFLRLPQAGPYTFWLGSDDGSRLWLGGALAIDNDGLHGYSERSVTVTLPAGDMLVRVEMFDHSGAERLTLDLEGPGLARRPVGGGLVWRR
jgi:hypothetical protein